LYSYGIKNLPFLITISGFPVSLYVLDFSTDPLECRSPYTIEPEGIESNRLLLKAIQMRRKAKNSGIRK
jgi:hypothetical protein